MHMAAKNKAAPAINMYGKNAFNFFILVIFSVYQIKMPYQQIHNFD